MEEFCDELRGRRFDEELFVGCGPGELAGVACEHSSPHVLSLGADRHDCRQALLAYSTGLCISALISHDRFGVLERGMTLRTVSGDDAREVLKVVENLIDCKFLARQS